MAPVAAKTWPTVGVRDVDRRLHSRILLQEARLLKAYSNSTTTNGKKKQVPN